MRGRRRTRRGRCVLRACSLVFTSFCTLFQRPPLQPPSSPISPTTFHAPLPSYHARSFQFAGKFRWMNVQEKDLIYQERNFERGIRALSSLPPYSLAVSFGTRPPHHRRPVLRVCHRRRVALVGALRAKNQSAYDRAIGHALHCGRPHYHHHHRIMFATSSTIVVTK